MSEQVEIFNPRSGGLDKILLEKKSLGNDTAISGPVPIRPNSIKSEKDVARTVEYYLKHPIAQALDVVNNDGLGVTYRIGAEATPIFDPSKDTSTVAAFAYEPRSDQTAIILGENFANYTNAISEELGVSTDVVGAFVFAHELSHGHRIKELVLDGNASEYKRRTENTNITYPTALEARGSRRRRKRTAFPVMSEELLANTQAARALKKIPEVLERYGVKASPKLLSDIDKVYNWAMDNVVTGVPDNYASQEKIVPIYIPGIGQAKGKLIPTSGVISDKPIGSAYNCALSHTSHPIRRGLEVYATSPLIASLLQPRPSSSVGPRVTSPVTPTYA